MIQRYQLRKALQRYRSMTPEEIAVREGLDIIEVVDMPARFEDALIHRTIFLPKGLDPPDRQRRIAHCLGHHFLHEGNQLLQVTDRPKQEREADLVAMYLMALSGCSATIS